MKPPRSGMLAPTGDSVATACAASLGGVATASVDAGGKEWPVADAGGDGGDSAPSAASREGVEGAEGRCASSHAAAAAAPGLVAPRLPWMLIWSPI